MARSRRSPRSSGPSAPSSHSSRAAGIFPLLGLVLLGAATARSAGRSSGTPTSASSSATRSGSRSSAPALAAAITLAVPLRSQPDCGSGRAPRRRAVPRPRAGGGRRGASCSCRSTSSSPPRGLALAYRILRGERPAPPPFLLALPLAAFVTFTATSFLWTWDERSGGIELAFFVFPFVAGLAIVARSPIASWLPRALLVTLVALGALFAAIGIWQAHTRTLFFGRDVAVANAYTSFFRVTSLFKDPSLYGRYLVVPIAVLLVAILVRRRTARSTGSWRPCSSRSSSSASTSPTRSRASSRSSSSRSRSRSSAPTAGRASCCSPARSSRPSSRRGRPGASIGGRSAKDVTSGRSRLVKVTLEAVEGAAGRGCRRRRPAPRELGALAQGVAEPERVAHGAAHRPRGARRRRLRDSTCGSASRRCGRSTSSRARDRTFGIGLAATLLVLFVHSLLYAGFFEDPLTWGVLGLAAAVLAAEPALQTERAKPEEPRPQRPELLAH